MNTIPALWDKLAGSVPLLVFIAVLTAFIVYHRQIGALLGIVTNVKFRDFSAEFDRAAMNAFDSAAQKVWKRPDAKQEYLTDPDLYFSDEDFTASKQLASMMPIRRWVPIAKLSVRQEIRSLVYDLADQFHKVRAEPPGNDRTKRQSAVVARLRMLTFAAHPMVYELIAADRAGRRVAAIAFLQVSPCYEPPVLMWLGERVSSREGQFVQYHAAGALLVACRNAEAQDMRVIGDVMIQTAKTAREMDKAIRSERAMELLLWGQHSLDNKSYAPMGVATRDPQRPESDPA
jgi:hypothetical protein